MRTVPILRRRITLHPEIYERKSLKMISYKIFMLFYSFSLQLALQRLRRKRDQLHGLHRSSLTVEQTRRQSLLVLERFLRGSSGTGQLPG